MKNYFACSVMLLLIFNATPMNAQKIGERIISKKDIELITYKPLGEGWSLYRNDRIEFTKVAVKDIKYPDPKEMKSRKVYDSISINTKTGKTVYFKGKVRRKSLDRYYYYLIVESDVKYAKTGAVYIENHFDKDGNLPETETLHHDNGLPYETATLDPASGMRYLRFDRDGELYFAYTQDTHKNVIVEHPKYGDVNQRFWSLTEIEPNVQLDSKSAMYIGYPHIGTLQTQTGYLLTGYTLPLYLEQGNGSVLFLENLNTSKYYWALIVDGVIEELKPAELNEKPDIKSLFAQTEIEALNFIGINDKNKGRRKEADQKEFIPEKELIKMSTKNLSNFTGYGVFMDYDDTSDKFKVINLTVGFLKNGKLDGMGYKVQLDHDKSTYRRTDLIPAIKWDGALGYFSNGELTGGRSFQTYIPITKFSDVFSIINFKNLVWKSYSPTRATSDRFIKFSELDPKYYIYSTDLNRVLHVLDIDQKAKTITVKGDVPNTTHTFNANEMNGLYGFEPKFESYQVSCPVTVQEPNYVYKDVPIFYMPEYKSNKTVVTGASYNKVTFTQTVSQGKAITVERSVQDGYKNVTCTKCNGTGLLTVTKQKGAWCKISF